MESTKQAIFYLDGNEYSMDVMEVSTIEKCVPIEPLENAPMNVKGIIELRGASMPVYSLRSKFGMQSKEQDADTRLIITNSKGIVMAYEVDKIHGIVDTSADQIYEVPSILQNENTTYLKRILSLDQRLIPILDKDGILTEEEFEKIKECL